MLRTLLAALLLLPWSLLSAAPVAHATARNAVIIGDSQAAGLNRPLTRALEGYDIHVVGASANVGKGLKWFLDTHTITNTISSNNPQVVILIIGGNDNVRTNGRTEGVSVDTYTQRLTTAYNQAAGSGRTVYWIGPATSRDTNVQTRHQATRTVQQSVLPGLGATWIDGMPGSADGPFQGDANASQRTHLTGEGYRRWACVLAAQIGGGPSTSCPTTADADQTFPDAVADADTADEGVSAAASAPSCDPNAAGVLPVHLGVSIGSLSEVNGLGEYVNAFYRYLAGISLIVAIVMVVYGGFRYLVGATSGDIGRGKEIIRDALVGMVLVLSAYAILNTINPATVALRTPVLTSISCVELPQVASDNRCETDSDCGTGSHCVTVHTVWSADEASSALISGLASNLTALEAVRRTFTGDIAGALLFARSSGEAVQATYGHFVHIPQSIKQCTDGTAGQPCIPSVSCTTGSDCTAQGACASGNICAEGSDVCIYPTNNPVGAPCNDNSNCASGVCEGSSTARHCRGHVPLLTNAAYRDNGYRVPEQNICFSNDDCEDAGSVCEGPSGVAINFCLRSFSDSVEEGSLCFLKESGEAWPPACSGTGGSDWTCLACPPTDSRNWERLNDSTDPAHIRMGSCRAATDVGTPCTSSAH